MLRALFEKYGVRQLAAGLHELLEGASSGQLTVIDELPDLETAREFWSDPEYQRVVPNRQQFIDAEVLLVDGLPTMG